ncbi:Protein argonaute 1B-like protein [Leptotrombidium deliense]|uniref:Protein argonaute 1B-like protein n=1 Tax=Leptotrombidium deliense TaxID=299467 RepID=A0A443RSW0_9ACAR|nr:Protein argonaute 1B-like protein [Leptotrombidium deliense]
MFVGVDVAHPAPGDRHELSIASCVGTYDNSYVHYHPEISVQQKARRELVPLNVSMEELLKKYGHYNKRYPDNIFIFRDGLSEG